MEAVRMEYVDIDIRRHSLVSTPSFIQRDSNVISINIFDNGKPADLSNIGKVIVNYKRPDRKIFSRELTRSGNVVEYRIGQPEMERVGVAQVELQLYDLTGSTRLSLFRFTVNIVDEIGTQEVREDNDDVTLLQEIFMEVEDIRDYSLTQAEAAKKAAESAVTNWKQPVANKAAVDALPSPKLGDTVQTNDNGYIYRYDGKAWVKTQEYGATALANVNAQLADMAINIKQFGAICDGTTDDWEAFERACVYCRTNKLQLYIPSVTRVVRKANITVPSMFGNSNSRLILEGDYLLFMEDGFSLRDIVIQASKETNIFKSWVLVNGISFSNVTLLAKVDLTNGTEHGKAAISFGNGVNNFKSKGLVIENFANPFHVGGKSSNLVFDDFQCSNFRTGVYLRGFDPKLPNGNFVDQVSMNNARLINTPEQRASLRSGTSYAGMSALLLEYVSNLNITNLKCENPAERAFYCSYGKDVVLDTWNLKNAGAIKFVGDNRKVEGAKFKTPANNNISTNFKASNIQSDTNEENAPLFEFYNVRGAYINNSHFNGNNMGDRFIVTAQLIEDLQVENCTAKNLTRAFWAYLDYANGYPEIDDGINKIDAKPTSDYDAWVKRASFRNITISNSCQKGYFAFSIEDSNAPAVGTYKYWDMSLQNVVATSPFSGLFDNVFDNTPFKGLISIDHVNNLRLSGCEVRGYKNWATNVNNAVSLLPFSIGSNSRSVYVKHSQIVTGTDGQDYFVGNLHVSVGSEITMISGNKSYGKSEKLTLTVNAPAVNANVDSTYNLNNNFILDIDATIKYGSNVFAVLFGNSRAGNTFPMPAKLYGFINVHDSQGNVGLFVLDSGKGMSLKPSSDISRFSPVYDNSKISVYRHSTDPIILLRGISSPAAVPTDVVVKARLQIAQ
ncbi:hypothetical protein BACI349Y_560047 [Bacillus sp. 349Y]|nr:hypothetical protein BACI349Y_560047 [Bacillus sp. 349Y]